MVLWRLSVRAMGWVGLPGWVPFAVFGVLLGLGLVIDLFVLRKIPAKNGPRELPLRD